MLSHCIKRLYLFMLNISDGFHSAADLKHNSKHIINKSSVQSLSLCVCRNSGQLLCVMITDVLLCVCVPFVCKCTCEFTS